VVLAANPLRFALTADAEVPEPIDCEVVDEYVDSVLDVPHSNHAVVDAPFGFTLPFIVAELVVTELAAVVVTDGAFAPVVKLRIASFCVPATFCPAAR
jgi:hypothetical protein